MIRTKAQFHVIIADKAVDAVIIMPGKMNGRFALIIYKNHTWQLKGISTNLILALKEEKSVFPVHYSYVQYQQSQKEKEAIAP